MNKFYKGYQALKPKTKKSYNWIAYVIVGLIISCTLAEVFFKPFIN